MMTFRRKIYNQMLEWKHEDDGKSALLIQGARRIGKSTIAELFAKNEYDSYILIDFVKCSKDIIRLFEDISDLDYIFLQLQLIYNVTLIERKSVIIFDEVQNNPLARQAIKYLVQDGRYDYIETGSLISIRQNVDKIVIPSEEYELNMYPMDYEEFRWALGDETSIPLLKKCFENKKPLGDAVNRKLMRDFRLYMLVGGMPQAVAEYINSMNLAKVDRVKRSIIRLYEKDFNKIDTSGNASKMFHNIPSQLTNNASRYMVSSVIEGGRFDRVSNIITEMEDSKVINLSYHANDPNVGLSFHKSTDYFKMFVGDTGLFVTLAFWDNTFTENIIYKKLLSDKLHADLGYIYENVVAQMLVASGEGLYYYTFPSETSNRNYEIDFIIPDGDKITPIEVKSSSYNAHKSFDLFCDKFSSRIKNKYIIYTKDLRKDGDITLLPIYMTGLL